jgi:hypothetical protein
MVVIFVIMSVLEPKLSFIMEAACLKINVFFLLWTIQSTAKSIVKFPAMKTKTSISITTKPVASTAQLHWSQEQNTSGNSAISLAQTPPNLIITLLMTLVMLLVLLLLLKSSLEITTSASSLVKKLNRCISMEPVVTYATFLTNWENNITVIFAIMNVLEPKCCISMEAASINVFILSLMW